MAVEKGSREKIHLGIWHRIKNRSVNGNCLLKITICHNFTDEKDNVWHYLLKPDTLEELKLLKMLAWISTNINIGIIDMWIDPPTRNSVVAIWIHQYCSTQPPWWRGRKRKKTLRGSVQHLFSLLGHSKRTNINVEINIIYLKRNNPK